MKSVIPFSIDGSQASAALQDCDSLLYELVAHLRKNRGKLHREWMRRIEHAQMLKSLDRSEIVAVSNSVYDGYVEALALGGLEGLRTFLRQLPDRLSLHGIQSHDALGLVYLLRDVLGRSLFREFRHFDGAETRRARGSEENRGDWTSAPPMPNASSLEAV